MSEAKDNIERRKWGNQPLSARMYGVLVGGGFVLFIPLFFRYNRTYLMVVAAWIWFVFVYSGLLLILGNKSTLLNLFFYESRFTASLPFHTPEIMLIFFRIMGVLTLAFMSYIGFEILRNGTAYAFQHFGR